MAGSDYDFAELGEWQVTCPITGRRIRIYGSRCVCSVCGVIFSGEDSFDRHRVGGYDPYRRRCRTPEEMWRIGLFLKDSGVVGRRAYRRAPTGTTVHLSLVVGTDGARVGDVPQTDGESDRATRVRRAR